MSKGHHPPFFKFYGQSTADVVLRNRTLRWSRPGTFNDPFDCQFDMYFPEVELGMREEVLERMYQSVYEDGPVEPASPMGRMILRLRGRIRAMDRAAFADAMGDSVNEVLANSEAMKDDFFRMTREHASGYKILCLSDRIDSVLMWSHYADQHAGVALRFDTPAGVDSPWRLARPIDYREDLPLAMTRDEMVDFAAGRYAMNEAAITEAMVLTKAAEWQYEHEWRLTSGSGRNPDEAFEDAAFNFQELTGIVLGARVPAIARSHFVELARAINPNVEVLQARLAPRAFRIETSSI